MPRDAPSDAAVPPAVVRAACLYYVEDLSQAEVAARMGVSRATVHNLLREARSSGLVRISLDPEILAREALARRLAAAFGLEAAHVLPDGGHADALPRAAAGMLDALVPHGSRLGVAWGETVFRLARHLPPVRRGDLTVVQIVGSMASPHGFDAEECSTLIARRMGAACVNLHAPAVLSSAALVQALTREDVIARQLAALTRCDVALLAVGLASPESHVVLSGVADLPTLEHYLGRGAAAVVAGRFVDRQGRAMTGPLDGRLIGIEPAALRAVPRRVVVSSGAARADALRAALRGGFASHLVTDDASARAVLAGL